MVDIELRVVNESGELVSINLDGTVDGKQVLRKEEIDALVNGKFGNWSFLNSELNVNGRQFANNIIGSILRINPLDEFSVVQIFGNTITFASLTNESIDNAGDPSAITKGWTLAKFPTTADVDGKFGNYTFSGDNFLHEGEPVIQLSSGLFLINPAAIYFEMEIDGDVISFPSLVISAIDSAGNQSAITKGWSLAKFFQQSQFINDFTGTSAQPILTDLNGKIASSLLPTQAAPQGNFTPTGGQEYPTLSGNVAGDYWIVNNVGAGYTFTAGDLVGEMVYESAWMVLDVNLNWILSNNYAGTVQAAWGSIIGTLTDQTDLNNALGLKADQLDLDTTNSNVSSNTVAIGNKANQSALDTTNTNVSDNADDIDANTIAIGLRATQADLDTTNTNVSTNTSDITTLEGDVSTLGSTKLSDVTAGTNVTIDKTDPLNPVISASGGTGGDGNYITFSGTTGGTATQNATALLNDLATTDELFIPKGNYGMGEAVIPSGKSLLFEQGAIFDCAGTLTGDDTGIIAGQTQIFTLTSLLDGYWSPVNEQAYIEWFGAKGDGTGTADGAAMQKTMEVFCKVYNFADGTGTGWPLPMNSYGKKNRACGFGRAYIIEQTVNIPHYGDILFGTSTRIINSYDDMYDSLFKATAVPFFFEGGKIRIRKYNDYASSPAGINPQNSLAEREQYSYNKNPVFQVLLNTPSIPDSTEPNDNFWTAEANGRLRTIIRNMDIRFYGGQIQDGDNSTLRFDGIYMALDNTAITDTSHIFEKDKHYQIVNYVAGDDFTNVFGTNTPGSNGLRCIATGTAAVWTNGSTIENAGRYSYTGLIENLIISTANISMEIQGLPNPPYGEMFNSWSIDNFYSDGGIQGLILGPRAAGHLITNIVLQAHPGYSEPLTSLPPQLTVQGGLNNIEGIIWDVTNDDDPETNTYYTAVRFEGAQGNNVVLSDQYNLLPAHNIDYGSNKKSNQFGLNSPFTLKNMGGGEAGVYWMEDAQIIFDSETSGTSQKMTGMGDKRYLSSLEATVAMSNPDIIPISTLRQTNVGFGTSGDLKTLTGTQEGLRIATQRSNGVEGDEEVMGGGFGGMIGFTANDQDAGDDNKQYQLGRFGFRQKRLTNPNETGQGEGQYQIWNRTLPEWKLTMHISETGNMGLQGVTRPSATIDLVGDAAGNTSGAVNTDQRIITNIGNFHPYAALPSTAGYKQGDMICVATSATDADMYLNTGSAWKAITRDP